MDAHLIKPNRIVSCCAQLSDLAIPGNNDRADAADETRMIGRSEDQIRMTGGDAPGLNTDVLLELFDGDRTAIAEILKAAIASIKTDVQRVEAAVDAHDAPDVSKAAHRLKGTSGTLGVGRLIKIASLIERAAKDGCWMVTPSLLADLRSTVDILSAQIDAYCEDSSFVRVLTESSQKPGRKWVEDTDF